MPSLNHVCMWVDNQWKPVKAEEIAKTHPGKISAVSGLLRCELCGQSVGMAHGEKKVPHFRHRSKEQDKECEDRALSLKTDTNNRYCHLNLPFRMRLNSETVFFEIGFINVPSYYLKPNSFIEISPSDKTSKQFFYSVTDRISSDGITYLSVGNMPSDHYTVTIKNADKKIADYWPDNVKGVCEEGTIFDSETGKRLSYDDDVVINKKYYLLTKRLVSNNIDNIIIQRVSEIKDKYQNWKIYEVIACDYSQNVAGFFWNYHCRLTEHPVKIQPVWPVYADSPYLIKHNRKEMYIHIAGEAELHLFPKAYSSVKSCINGKIAKISVNNKQQFISVGRTHALKYKYFWQEMIQKPLSEQNAAVVDKQNSAVASGVVDRLPQDRIIRCTFPYDGTVVIKENGITKEKRSVKAGEQTTINNINWGMSIAVFIGLDPVWEASFEKAKSESQEENELLSKLRACSGNMVDVPHSFGSLAHYFKNNPKIRQWIYQCVRQGRISEKALKMIKSYIVNGKVV